MRRVCVCGRAEDGLSFIMLQGNALWTRLLGLRWMPRARMGTARCYFSQTGL